MAELLLVNPRRRAKKARRKNPMPRALAKYWATHGRTKRRKNPSVRAHAPAKRRRRKNPSLRGIAKGAGAHAWPMIKNGAIGSIGALLNDFLIGNLAKQTWMPTTLTTGTGASFLKVIGALLIGVGAGAVSKGKAALVGEGAMTVVFRDLVKAQLVAQGWAMGEYLTFAPTVGYSPGMGQYLTGPGSGQMGEYITNDIGNADYYGVNAPGYSGYDMSGMSGMSY